MNKTRLKYQTDTGIRAEIITHQIQNLRFDRLSPGIYEYIHWLEDQVPGPIIKTHVLDEKK